MSYFCPKRFNRFPRFTIFFKNGENEVESSYVKENTVSLNADFLKFLSDTRNTQAAPSSPPMKIHGSKLKGQNANSSQLQSQVNEEGNNVPGENMQKKTLSVRELA